MAASGKIVEIDEEMRSKVTCAGRDVQENVLVKFLTWSKNTEILKNFGFEIVGPKCSNNCGKYISMC